MTVFLDTSGLFATLDRDDANHPAARDVWTGLVERDVPLATTNYVIIESMALVQRRLGVAALRDFCTDALALIHQEWVTRDDHAAALAGVLAANRRSLSYVDVSSFQVMRRMGVREVFTFDPHFEEHGFILLPARGS